MRQVIFNEKTRKIPLAPKKTKIKHSVKPEKPRQKSDIDGKTGKVKSESSKKKSKAQKAKKRERINNKKAIDARKSFIDKHKCEENEEEEESTSTGCSQALEYLKKWKESRSEWSFQKVRQVWLLKHMFDMSLVPESDFEVLLEYMVGLKGLARQHTVESAEKMIQTSNDVDNEDKSEEEDEENDTDDLEASIKKTKQKNETNKLTKGQLIRIKQVLQILS